MATYNHLSDGRPDGALLGNDSSDKIGMWGTAPAARRAGAATQAALTLTTVTSSSPFGLVTTTGMTALIAQVEEIRATLVALGFMAGGA
jgi:hypothetical protein